MRPAHWPRSRMPTRLPGAILPPVLIALYKALGGGWEVRLGNDFVPAEVREQMSERTDWGDMLETVNDKPPVLEPDTDLWRSPDW